MIKVIDEKLVLDFTKGLQDSLVTGFKLDSPGAQEICASLVAESP